MYVILHVAHALYDSPGAERVDKISNKFVAGSFQGLACGASLRQRMAAENGS